MSLNTTQLPHIGIAALDRGSSVSLTLSDFHGQWGLICHLPQLGLDEARLLNHYSQRFQQRHTMLVVVPKLGWAFDQDLFRHVNPLSFIICPDRDRSVLRALGLPDVTTNTKCHSLVFDPQGSIRFHVAHALDVQGFQFLEDVLTYYQGGAPQPRCPISYDPGSQRLTYCQSPLFVDPSICRSRPGTMRENKRCQGTTKGSCSRLGSHRSAILSHGEGARTQRR